MRPTAARLTAFLTSHGLPPEGRVAVACSGGPDSVLLLALAREALPGRVACAHYDHRLRPDSAADAAFVRRLCGDWGIPFLGGSGDVRRAAARAKRGLEETARAMRYAFLEKARVKLGAEFVLTAHNLDDQAETVLFRAARGTKLTGLAGIPARQGAVLRPLLDASKADILAELGRRGLPFRTDPTNADRGITRNFIRHEVVPLLEKVNPAARDALGRLAAYARELGTWMEDELAPLLRDGDGGAAARPVSTIKRRNAADGGAGRETASFNTLKQARRGKNGGAGPAAGGHFALAEYRALPRVLRAELVRMTFARVAGSGDGLTEANLGDIDRFLHGPGNPRSKEMFGVRLEKRGKIAAFGPSAGKKNA